MKLFHWLWQFRDMGYNVIYNTHAECLESCVVYFERWAWNCETPPLPIMQGLVKKIGFHMQYLTVELLINGYSMKNTSCLHFAACPYWVKYPACSTTVNTNLCDSLVNNLWGYHFYRKRGVPNTTRSHKICDDLYVGSHKITTDSVFFFFLKKYTSSPRYWYTSIGQY